MGQIVADILQPSTFVPTASLRAKKWGGPLRAWMPLLTVVGVIALWQVVIVMEWLPAFILPSPSEVLEKLAAVLQSGMLQHHTVVTLQQMTLGLAWGVAIGSVLGYLIAHNRYLEAALSPLIVAFQATPVVAYAPLLIIWFGNGMMSKVVTCAIIVFFPTLMNTIVGIRSVPRGWHEVFRSMRATRWQRLWLLELPAALPIFLGGLKTSATLALIGAVVGEFVSAREGLGYMVTLARNQFDTPLVFVGVFTMTALALSFYSAVSVMERLLLRWQQVHRQY